MLVMCLKVDQGMFHFLLCRKRGGFRFQVNQEVNSSAGKNKLARAVRNGKENVQIGFTYSGEVGERSRKEKVTGFLANLMEGAGRSVGKVVMADCSLLPILQEADVAGGVDLVEQGVADGVISLDLVDSVFVCAESVLVESVLSLFGLLALFEHACSVSVLCLLGCCMSSLWNLFLSIAVG